MVAPARNPGVLATRLLWKRWSRLVPENERCYLLKRRARGDVPRIGEVRRFGHEPSRTKRIERLLMATTGAIDPLLSLAHVRFRED